MISKHAALATLAAIAACALALQITRVEATGVTETVLYSFCSQGNCTDGDEPQAGVINVAGALYGTTTSGGQYRGGTAFALDPTTGVETVIYSFGSTTDDGRYPTSRLRTANGTLYGTTLEGGTGGSGTVFSLDPGTGAETVLYSFTSPDGAKPAAGLIGRYRLYGTTSQGGSSGGGTVFALDANTGAETILHDFGSGTDGQAPQAGLIRVSGMLYGTTSQGGANGWGTVFTLDPKTKAESVLYSFGSGTDGRIPVARLVYANGMLYGTTSLGGTYDYGTTFALDQSTGVETTLRNFGGGTDGREPVTSMISRKSILYGTTAVGGAYGDGTLFSLDPNTGTYAVLYDFDSGAGGYQPYGDLIAVDGKLYGTTLFGGAYFGGTVFEINNLS